MGFKINMEIKPLNESEIRLMNQDELEDSLKRLDRTLKQKFVSKGLDEHEEIQMKSANNITAEMIAKMNQASLLM
jgi:hypothetical protein